MAQINVFVKGFKLNLGDDTTLMLSGSHFGSSIAGTISLMLSGSHFGSSFAGTICSMLCRKPLEKHYIQNLYIFHIKYMCCYFITNVLSMVMTKHDG